MFKSKCIKCPWNRHRNFVHTQRKKGNASFFDEEKCYKVQKQRKKMYIREMSYFSGN